ncbi:extracellular solute-binding protein [Cohnella hashimotonis]|uniref:Extracellular solute-binding protein n=1 Tax=Cohnella hashimotonis TaxID=2826895 RepID=A0ABT6TDX9_9BACL|nr:extracellular solute-binding protein [Cohnella hashimotonis]MDI4645036.1 extracellular solute-binding protein [Cohnella hashimotonis]
MNLKIRRTFKCVSTVVVAAMVPAFLLGACSGSSGNAIGTSSTSPTSADASVSKPTELSLWIPLTADFKGKNYNEKPSFQKMEKETNVHINFEHVSDADVENLFNLLMASGDLPDMIYYYNWDAQATKYGNSGALLPLEDLIREKAPNLERVLNENPEIRGQITSPEGHIYYIPNMALDSTLLVQMFPQVRQDWLDKLGLEAPKTTDDWYTVLKAFREKDANGNGKADESPFVSIGLDSGMNGASGAAGLFAPAFGIEFGFFVEDGKVKYGPYDPRFKDLMAFMHKLDAENLLDTSPKDFAALREKVLSGQAGAWFGWAGSYMGTFTALMKEKDAATSFEVSPVLPPVGPNGDQRHTSHRWPASSFGIAVSSKTDKPEEIIKWLDYQFSEEGVILNNFGVEGEGYTMQDGKPVYTDKIVKPADGSPPSVAILSQTIGGGAWPTITNVDGALQMNAANGQATSPTAQFASYIDLKKKLPPLQFTKEETDIIAPIMADLSSFIKEASTNFVNGQLPLDNFDKYLKNVEKMKLSVVLEQYQKAYDRFIQQ